MRRDTEALISESVQKWFGVIGRKYKIRMLGDVRGKGGMSSS
jgi:hypothetical protein